MSEPAEHTTPRPPAAATRAAQRMADGTTGAVVAEMRRNRSTLKVYVRHGPYGGARVLLDGDGGALFLLDVRRPELRRLANALHAAALLAEGDVDEESGE